MPLLYVSELIDIAIKDEEAGVEFYRALAASVRDGRVRERMLAIAAQEVAQVEWFKKMRAEIGEAQVAEQYPGEDDEYLRAITAPAFPATADAGAFARRAATDAEAVDLAMRLEKDTLLLLTEMKRFLGEEHHKYVDVVIDEEKEHLVELADMRRMLGAKG